MPMSRVIPKRLPSSPGRDSRFSLRTNPSQGGVLWVHYKPPGAKPIPADDAHPELVELVNFLKESTGSGSGGGFSINEYGQVVAHASASSGYAGNSIRVMGLHDGTGEVVTYKKVITFRGGVLDPRAMPAEGTVWPGPLCGATYRFAAVGNAQPPSCNFDEVWGDINGQKVQLSTVIALSTYPPKTGPLSTFLAALRRQLPGGGRFRVNEHGRAFTSDKNIFIGQVPLSQWFRPLGPTS